MTRHQRARRRFIWIGSAQGLFLFCLLTIVGPSLA